MNNNEQDLLNKSASLIRRVKIISPITVLFPADLTEAEADAAVEELQKRIDERARMQPAEKVP